MAPSFSRSQLEMSPKMSELPSPVVPLSLLSPRTELSRSITIVFLTQHDGTVATIKEFRFIASFSVCFSLVQFERASEESSSRDAYSGCLRPADRLSKIYSRMLANVQMSFLLAPL